jgi:hypothetical protein
MSEENKNDNHANNDYHKGGNREIHNASKSEIARELQGFFEHVKTHDLEKVEFAIMVVGHEGSTAETGGHVCTAVGGQRKHIAKAVVHLMRDLIEDDPSMALTFLIELMGTMGGQAFAIPLGPNGQPQQGFDPKKLGDFDKLGDSAAKDTVQNFLKNLGKKE